MVLLAGIFGVQPAQATSVPLLPIGWMEGYLHGVWGSDVGSVYASEICISNSIGVQGNMEVSPPAATLYLSTLGSFSVSGLSGADDDVFVCAAASVGEATACNYSFSLYFDGSSWGLRSNDGDAFDRG